MKELHQFIDKVVGDRDQIVALGLILYTDAHPHLKKALRNDDYWKALDEISGHKWTILSARAEAGEYQCAAPPPGTLALMRKIWCEPVRNKTLLQSFRLVNTESLPLFVLFTPLGDDSLLQSTVRLDDSSELAAYNRLKYVVSSLTSAVDYINMDNRANYEAVFNAIDAAMYNIKEKDFFKKALNFCSWVKSLIPK